VCVCLSVCLCGIVKISLLAIVGVQILRPEIDMISEMRICLLLGIMEAAAAKAVDLATKFNMTSLHPTHGLLGF
jgi:hypothetical protein